MVFQSIAKQNKKLLSHNITKACVTKFIVQLFYIGNDFNYNFYNNYAGNFVFNIFISTLHDAV